MRMSAVRRILELASVTEVNSYLSRGWELLLVLERNGAAVYVVASELTQDPPTARTA